MIRSAHAEELLERLNAPHQPSSRSASPKHSADRPPPHHFRLASELDATEREALAARDEKIERWSTRFMLGYALPSMLAGLVAHAALPAFPQWWALFHFFMLWLWIVWLQVRRCPNCCRVPSVIRDHCPVCGCGTITAGFDAQPVCTTCCTTITYGRRGKRNFPLMHCSNCGLRLGRHNNATGYHRPSAVDPHSSAPNEHGGSKTS